LEVENRRKRVGKIVFITGTDTGVGKTVLTALLLQHLREEKVHALAIKPFCSGDRADVKMLQKLQPSELSDSEMNPYFFVEPVAPFVAAEKLRKTIRLHEVVQRIARIQSRCDVLLVEGIGGVMVPLGKDFSVKDLIVALNATTIVVSRNRIGTINHTLLTVFMLQNAYDKRLTIALMETDNSDFSSKSNQKILKKLAESVEVFSIPLINTNVHFTGVVNRSEKKIKKTLAAILKCV
jgi:dethiobiotin synthetase